MGDVLIDIPNIFSYLKAYFLTDKLAGPINFELCIALRTSSSLVIILASQNGLLAPENWACIIADDDSVSKGVDQQ